MSGGDAKIKIKVGEVEIDYEGDAAFLKDGLLEVCKELSQLNEHIPVSRTPQHHKAREDHAGGKSLGKHSIVTIATLLGANSGPELVGAAAAYLHFSEGKTEFTRAEILNSMKTATGYWQENYSANLSGSLKSLTKADKLRVVRDDTYSLPAKESKRLEAEIAKA
jgi:hypothetical protein